MKFDSSCSEWHLFSHFSCLFCWGCSYQHHCTVPLPSHVCFGQSLFYCWQLIWLVVTSPAVEQLQMEWALEGHGSREHLNTGSGTKFLCRHSWAFYLLLCDRHLQNEVIPAYCLVRAQMIHSCLWSDKGMHWTNTEAIWSTDMWGIIRGKTQKY